MKQDKTMSQRKACQQVGIDEGTFRHRKKTKTINDTTARNGSKPYLNEKYEDSLVKLILTFRRMAVVVKRKWVIDKAVELKKAQLIEECLAKYGSDAAATATATTINTIYNDNIANNNSAEVDINDNGNVSNRNDATGNDDNGNPAIDRTTNRNDDRNNNFIININNKPVLNVNINLNVNVNINVNANANANANDGADIANVNVDMNNTAREEMKRIKLPPKPSKKWCSKFINKHKDQIRWRRTDPTSKSKLKAEHDQTTVQMFAEDLEEIFNEHPHLDASRIFNLDETAADKSSSVPTSLSGTVLDRLKKR
jgi:hypothetical protein